MASTTVVKFVVKSLSQYGFFTEDNKSVYTKKTPESDKAQIVPGVSFEGEVWTSDKGAMYLNKIVALAPAQPKVFINGTKVTDTNPVVYAEQAKKAVNSDRAKHFMPSFAKKVASDNTMSKAEWSAKDRSQLIGGLSHDAAAITAVMVNVDGLNKDSALALYKELLVGMLAIREEVK